MELFEHQKEGIAFLQETDRAILADEMGLGKTRQAVLAAGIYPSATLVVCPASLKINWKREIQQVYPEDEVFVVSGGRLTDEAGMRASAWVIVNYDILKKHTEWIVPMVQNQELGTVILDEAHYIKGKGTERTEAALEVCKHAMRVYALTGTPIMNRPIELFNILKAIRHPLAKARTTFVKKYCGGQLKALVMEQATGRRWFIDPKKAFPYRKQPDKYRVFTFTDEEGAQRLPELRMEIQDVFLRRLKKDRLDLPPKIISTVDTELTPEWRKAYDTAWDRYMEWIETYPSESRDIQKITGAQQLIEVGKLKQVCSLSKITRICDDIENAIEQGEKVIVFTQYRDTVWNLQTELVKRKVGWVKLTGDDTAEERQAAVDAFQTDPAKSAFIANIQAGGVGITLTAASIVIFADMDWSPAVNEQAEDRAHRIGQKGTVNIYYYVATDTIEEDIMKMLAEKRGIIDQVVDGQLSTEEVIH